MGLVGLVNNLIVGADDNVLMITSFGASAVLLYGAPKSPLAQPRNLVGGHLLAAFIGVAIYKAFFFQLWFASALTVATAIAVMHLTRTLHPCRGYRVVCSNRWPQYSPDGIFLPDLPGSDRCRHTFGRCPGFQQSFEESTISAVLDIDNNNSELSCFPLSKLLFQRWIKNPFVCVVGSSLGDGYSLNPGRSFGWGFILSYKVILPGSDTNRLKGRSVV